MSNWKFIGNWKLPPFASIAFGGEIGNFGKQLTQPEFFLLWWLIVMSIPAVISNEGIPHAIRTIGMIPPAMILAALGFVSVSEKIASWLQHKKHRYPKSIPQLTRIGWELGILGGILLLALPLYTTKQYFFDWAYREETLNSFSEPYTALGHKLARLPQELPKYVIVNEDGVLVRGIPMPAQTVMFVAEGGIANWGVPTLHNIIYILPEDEKMLESISEPHITVRLNQ